MRRLDYHREMSEAPPDMLAMARLIRQLKRHCRREYAGYTLNKHFPGSVTVDLYDGRSINIAPDGKLSWVRKVASRVITPLVILIGAADIALAAASMSGYDRAFMALTEGLEAVA